MAAALKPGGVLIAGGFSEARAAEVAAALTAAGLGGGANAIGRGVADARGEEGVRGCTGLYARYSTPR